MAKLSAVAVFADTGVTAHQALYRQAGATIARNQAHLHCIARNGQWPRTLVESALAGGGRVTVATGPVARRLDVPQGVEIVVEETEAAAAARIVEAGQALIGLPGGIDTIAALYSAWVAAGGAQSERPVGLLNQGRAYEVVRGFAGDVAAIGRGNIDALIQISETFDDLWNRLARLA
ncbi:MAG: hypothetical protein RIB57_01755 [Pelagibacterium sp.]|jgi:hypothetical protein|uniref:hypothetical protein n=1 Tax=Pelagibacterium sp. TaxID=1967288 RepID=UPI0032EEF61D|tara:strand:+ start:11434 stop:11964 length:531 start_codon:yes stop_codon:yes gene_type:complete